jgi:hypothetical protein
MTIFSNTNVALELLKTGERDFIIDHEIEVAHYLSECFDSKDPSILDLCFELSRFAVSEGRTFTFSEVADMMIEEYLDPEERLEDVLVYLEQDLPKRFCSPLWHLLARSSYRGSSDFRQSLVRFFKKDPCFFAEVMERTEDSFHVSTIEDMLKVVAPCVKYMPRFEDSHEVFLEHDFWLRGGSSFIRLSKLPMSFLETAFLDVLPNDLDDWLESCTNQEEELFKRRHKEYLNLFVTE